MTPGIPLLSCLVLLITSNSLRPSSAETSTCLTVYREGGAPAVFHSPKCPRWNLFSDDQEGRPVYNCQVAVHQGRRRSQEDRAVCAIDVRIPFAGANGVRDVRVGIIAVFDGHNGEEASEMASKLLLEYFFLHVHFLLDGLYSAALSGPGGRLVHDVASDVFFRPPDADMGQRWRNFDLERYRWILPRIFDSNLHLEILKESLLRTIHDIDVTFSKEAFRKDFHSGSTATVVLLANGQILVVNVGDSKAILCSESFDPPMELKGKTLRLSRRGRRNRATFPVKNYKTSDAVAYYQKKYVHVKELTIDHHPDREDEKNRVEAAGGFVEWLGVPRVNGMLAVSRAIGDVSLKSYGVIPTPEVTDWQPLGSNDSYLIVATDGVFEKLTARDVCDLLWDTNAQGDVKAEFILNIAHSLADHIVRTALERGTMDNLAAVVVPLMSPGISSFQIKDIHKEEGRKGTSCSGSENFEYIKSGKSVNGSSLISMEYFNKITTNFNKLLVETNNKKLGCFYLSENLNNNKDYDFLQAKIRQKTRVHDLSGSLSEALKCNHNAEAKKLYSIRTFCSLFELDLGVKNHGSEHGNFEKFFGLLDSFPYNGTGFGSADPPEYKLPELRYTLERQFGGGSYGEVWLAFQWNCSEVGGNFSCQHAKLNFFHEDVHVYNTSLHNKSSCGYYFSGDDDNSYILKRIKVEKGNVAYRSGLREKYFGEMFLRASSNGCIPTTSTSSLLDVGCTTCGTLQFDEHDSVKLSHAYSCNRDAYEGLAHIARFVEYFESPSEGIWLVFRNEGISLKKLLYSDKEQVFSDAESDDQVKKPQIFHPSSWWRWLRTTETGRREMRNLIHQLLLALKACHVRNITHRDIKPENMIVCFQDTNSGRCLTRIPSGRNYYHPMLRLIDFGSAIDKFTLKNLYGSGPTRSEQTFAYTSPEALLNASWFQAPNDVVMKYDMWSVGVFMMELILGSPNIFETGARTRAVIYQQLEGWSEDIKELAYKLKSYMDMCIIVPGIFPKYHFQDHDKESCSEESFSEQIKRRDPLKLGFPNIWTLRFVHQLLVWQPEDRLSVDEALQHPYFHYDT